MSKARNAKLIVALALLGAVSVVIFLPYYAATLGDTLEKQAVPAAAAYAAFVIQTALLVLLASWLGVTAGSRVGLDAPWLRALMYGGRRPAWSGKWLLLAVGVSLAGSLAVAALQAWVFGPYLPDLETAGPIAWWKTLLTMFYGGIVEEILLRVGLMSVLVWLGSVALRKREAGAIPSYVYAAAIVLSTLLFGAGHLPAASVLADGLTGPLIGWVLVGNGLLGLWFGYLYWKKGLEYAVIAHMSADLWLHAVIGPLSQ